MQSIYIAMNGLYTQFTTLVGGVDIFYSLICGSMVLLMQCGFIMNCIGSVLRFPPDLRKIPDVLLKHFAASFSAMIGFWSIGFGLAFQRGPFLGTSGEQFFLQAYTNYIDFFFQSTFALTVTSIVVGTVVSSTPLGCCKTIGCVLYAFFLTAFVYPVIVHAIWNDDGFLSAFSEDPPGGEGMIDFAGSGVVHVTGGATALVAIVILRHFQSKNTWMSSTSSGTNETLISSSSPTSPSFFAFLPHCSMLLQVLGTFTLWIGWYGFNAGSTLAISPPGYGDAAALCAVTTTLSATCGGLTCMFFDALVGFSSGGYYGTSSNRKRRGVNVHHEQEHHDDDHNASLYIEYDVSMAMKGCLSGLVAITAGCSVVEPWAALVIGCISGIVFVLSSKVLGMKVINISDSMGTISIHLMNGIWGCMATGIFASPRHVKNAFGFDARYSGLLYVNSSNGVLFINEILGIVFILAWTIGTMTCFFFLLHRMGLLCNDDHVMAAIVASSENDGRGPIVLGNEQEHDPQGILGEETEMLTKSSNIHHEDIENDNDEEHEKIV